MARIGTLASRRFDVTMPISISFDGVSKSVGMVQDLVVPWRREHAKELAKCDELERRTKIALLEAEVAEKEAKGEQSQVEVQVKLAKAEQERAKARRMELENQKLALQLQKAKMEAMLKIIAPNASEIDRLRFFTELLPHVERLITSPIEFAAVLPAKDVDIS